MNIRDIDFDLSFLREVTGVLDSHLDRIEPDFEDAESTDAPERSNHVYGLGLVACQNYIAETISFLGIERSVALDLEPIHVRSGIPIAALTNSAANFWKHHSEWPVPPPLSNRAVAHMRALGVDPSGPYAIANAFYRLVSPHPTRFHSLVPFLQRWRDTIRKHVGP